MKGQYHQPMYNLPTINSYSINFSSETKKTFDNDNINSYNTNLDEMKELTNEPSYINFNPTKNNDYFINISEDPKKLKFHENLSSPLSSFPSSLNSSTISLSLPSPSTYSPSTYSPSSYSPSLSTQNAYLSNELCQYIKPYSYEPLYMKIPEIKKEFTKSNPKTNVFPKINIFLRPFTFYPSGKIDRIWRYLVRWSILLTLLCYLVSLNFFLFIVSLIFF
jgi:hypothetical protein